MICCEAFIPFCEAFEKSAQVYVDVRTSADARAGGIEYLGEVWGKGVLEVGRERLSGEFFGDGDGGLFAPDGQFLVLR